MWPFKQKKSSLENIAAKLKDIKLPGDEMANLFKKAVRDLGEEEALNIFLESCNFELARDEISDFFKLANASAEREGKGIYYKPEYVNGWYAFSANPCADTVRAWLRAAPEYKDMIEGYLIECCPGGKFEFYHSMKR